MNSTTTFSVDREYDAIDEIAAGVLRDMERAWRVALPRLTDSQALVVFPEARLVIEDKICEWQEKREYAVDTIRRKLIAIKTKPDPETRWFLRELAKAFDSPALLEADRQLSRLYRLQRHMVGKPQSGNITDVDIEHARSAPIERVFDGQLRKSGRNLTGLCPLHHERTPSFYIYAEQNRWWCFGACGRGGDSISFIRERDGLSFPEAVRYLTNL